MAGESDTLERLAADAIALAENRQRAVLGIAGSPGAGKSTLVEQLLVRIGERMGPDWVAHVPMDGFHLADEQLRYEATEKLLEKAYQQIRVSMRNT